MCGICGVLSSVADDERLAEITESMMDSLVHRGPDGSGSFRAPHVSLGHRRLAIIDLVTGDQPMTSADKRFSLVFNGEIYNYIELREELKALGRKFRTTSDTEVLLQAFEEWGPSLTTKLNGMWSFAVWDTIDKKLFLSRDGFGIRPLYYSLKEGLLLFASEPKALLASGEIPRKVNDAIAYDYLMFTITDHTSETFFDGIMQLPPGHSLLIDLSFKPKLEKFWQIPSDRKLSAKAEVELAEEFKSLFTDAVRIRLRSDVPVGSCLSGGMDSNSIVCTAQNLLKGADGKYKSMETFSAVFDEPEIDESRYIKETQRLVTTNSHFITPTKEEVLADIREMVRSQDEPFISSSIIAQSNVMRLAHENRVKVLLDGQGADETIGGYTRFISSRAADMFGEGDIRGAIRTLLKTRSGMSERLATGLLFLSMACSSRIGAAVEALFNFIMRSRTFDASVALNPSFRAKWKERSFDRFRKMPPFLYSSLKFSTEYRMCELLRYEDRNSMRYSIETRLPFLDYRLVSLEFTMPDSLKMNEDWTKWVLRQAMVGVIPDAIRMRKDKLGFDAPDRSWVEHILRNGGLEMLSKDPRVVSHGIIDREFLGKLVSSFPKYRDWKFVWRILNLEIWLREVIESGAVAPRGR